MTQSASPQFYDIQGSGPGYNQFFQVFPPLMRLSSPSTVSSHNTVVDFIGTTAFIECILHQIRNHDNFGRNLITQSQWQFDQGLILYSPAQTITFVQPPGPLGIRIMIATASATGLWRPAAYWTSWVWTAVPSTAWCHHCPAHCVCESRGAEPSSQRRPGLLYLHLAVLLPAAWDYCPHLFSFSK